MAHIGGLKNDETKQWEGCRLVKRRRALLASEPPHTGAGKMSSRGAVDVCREGRGGSQRVVLLNSCDTDDSEVRVERPTPDAV